MEHENVTPNMRKNFEEFKKAWMNSSTVSNFEYTAHGDNHQRDFYLFDGVQITVHTCFPYSIFKKSSVHFSIDCVIPNSKEVKSLLKNIKVY